jgi:hypothetical protein
MASPTLAPLPARGWPTLLIFLRAQGARTVVNIFDPQSASGQVYQFIVEDMIERRRASGGASQSKCGNFRRANP